MSNDAGAVKERIEAIAQSISLSAAMLKHKGVR